MFNSDTLFRAGRGIYIAPSICAAAKNQPLLFTMRNPFTPILGFLLFVPLAIGDSESPAITIQSTFKDSGGLQKRANHRESPLIYYGDDHPLEYYWTKPYYPSRL